MPDASPADDGCPTVAQLARAAAPVDVPTHEGQLLLHFSHALGLQLGFLQAQDIHFLPVQQAPDGLCILLQDVTLSKGQGAAFCTSLKRLKVSQTMWPAQLGRCLGCVIFMGIWVLPGTMQQAQQLKLPEDRAGHALRQQQCHLCRQA